MVGGLISADGRRQRGVHPMSFLIEMFLIIFLPSIAAFAAIGGTGKKLAWYTGTAAAAFCTDMAFTVLFMAYAQANHFRLDDSTLLGMDAIQREMLTWFGMLIVDVALIALAANSGKKCSFCMSKIDPKARRCPRCQAVLLSSAPTPDVHARA
jgi:hypothetical protein